MVCRFGIIVDVVVRVSLLLVVVARHIVHSTWSVDTIGLTDFVYVALCANTVVRQTRRYDLDPILQGSIRYANLKLQPCPVKIDTGSHLHPRDSRCAKTRLRSSNQVQLRSPESCARRPPKSLVAYRIRR